MPRPKRCLCPAIQFEPSAVYFKPQGIPLCDSDIVELFLEEIESIRLRYLDNFEQEEAAEKMDISQSTYQRLLHSAYKKITDALVNGKSIRIKKHE